MLVNCVAYQDGRIIAHIQPSEISAYVSRPECFVWVALFEPSPEELDAMQVEFGLHELAVEDARHGHQRPKIEEYGESLFAVLHTVELAGAELKVGEVAVFVGRNYVLSISSRTERGFAEVRARCEREPELLQHGSGYVLYAIMDAVVDRYFPVLDALEVELEEIERRIFSGQQNRAIIQALYDLKQKLMTVKHAIGPLLEGTAKLYGGRVPQQCVQAAGVFPRRVRPPGPAELDGRQLAGDGHDRHFGEPVAPHHPGQRGHEAVRSLRGARRSSDHGRRNLWDELPAHAGARLGPGLSCGDRNHGRFGCISLLSLPQGQLVVTIGTT